MPVEFIRTSRSEAETERIGHDLAGMLRGGDVLLLDGPLGAGKTALVRAVADAHGVEPGAASSPTFVVAHVYRRGGGQGFHPDRPDLVHIDAYRLRGGDDFESLGLEGVLERVRGRAGEQPQAPIMLVEWAERLPPDALRGIEAGRLRIEMTGPESRELWFSLPDDWGARPGLDALRRRGATRCPVTGKPVSADSPTWPFADERARLADLHRWFSGAYTIGRTPDPDDDA